MPEATPPILDGYAASRLVSSSGTTESWEAVQLSLERPVVLVVPAGAGAATEAMATVFETRARAYARLRGDAFLPVIDIGRLRDGRPYAAFERSGGRAVADVVASEGPLSASRAIDVAVAVAGACDAAWKQSAVVFRAISPRSVILDSGNAVRVATFDSIWLAERASESMMLDMGGVAGEPGFMAPEQADKSAAIDFRADIYALGALLCFMITGKTPGEGGLEGAPSAIAEVVGRMTAPSPSLRPDSWSDVIESLRLVASGKSATSAPGGGSASAASAPVAGRIRLKPKVHPAALRVSPETLAGRLSDSTAASARGGKGRFAAAALGFVALLAVVGGVAWWRFGMLESAPAPDAEETPETAVATDSGADNDAVGASQSAFASGGSYSAQPYRPQSSSYGGQSSSSYSSSSSSYGGGQSSSSYSSSSSSYGGQTQQQRPAYQPYNPVTAAQDGMFRRISYAVHYRPYPACIEEVKNAIRDTGKRTKELEKNCLALWTLVNEMPTWVDLVGIALSETTRETELVVGNRHVLIRKTTGYSRPNLICEVKFPESDWAAKTLPLDRLSTKEMFAALSGLSVDKSDKALVSRALLILREGTADDFRDFVEKNDVKPLKPLTKLLGR